MASTNMTGAQKTKRFFAFGAFAALAAIAAAPLAGCGRTSEATGSFSKNFTVSGPVRLELTTGSGDARITTGNPGEVAVSGEINVHERNEQEAQQRVRAAEASPPIIVQGNTIRVGGAASGNYDVDFTIVVPPHTEIHGLTGSGDVTIDGVQGPVDFISGSGDISASNVAGDVRATSGSGAVQFANIQGRAEIASGSGDATASKVKGETRIRTGSGDVHADHAGDDLDVQTSSGDVVVEIAAADLRVRTSSGNVTITGSPSASHFWDFHTTSGDVTLNVSSSASFRLYAHSSGDGDIDAAIPIVMEGTSAKHELRARIGDGAARVEIGTVSGDISLH